MESRIVQNSDDLGRLVSLLSNHKLPFTVAIRNGKHRTNPQNALQHRWYQEAAEQLQDHTAGEYKAYCKLTFGVPILRGTDERFNEMWRQRVEGLPRIQKLQVVEYISVTSLMTTVEKKQYLDAVQRFLLERGVRITDPEVPR